MAEIFAVLERLNREAGTTIVMVEHRVDELAHLVSRVVMMDKGAIMFDGVPRDAFLRRRSAHAGESHVMPVSAWFPQAAEFALALTDACGMVLDAQDTPLDVAEAVAFAASRVGIAAAPAPAAPAPAARPEAKLLQVKSLSFGYDRKQPILQDISFTLGDAGIVALCGRNGSGKTTLARLLMRINQPPRGAIWLGDKDVATLGPREISTEIGYVFQNPDHQFVTDRVWDEIAYGLRARDYSEQAIKDKVGEMLQIVDLERYRDRSPFSLSLGERRRLSVATMLVLEPRLLVLDEPTIGQDHERAQQLMRLMVRLRERYRTVVLMITHDVRLVAEWAERTLVVSRGRLLFDGIPGDMFADDGLLAEAGLLAPPVFSISKALAAQHPDSAVHPTLSLDTLVAAISGRRGVRA